MLSSFVTVLAAEETHHEVDHVLSWGIGAGMVVVFFGMIFALMAFGAGREHS